MEPLVLGFSGPTASGKSSLSKAIAATLGWRRISFGDYVLVKPTPFALVYVGIDDATRSARLVTRGETDDRSLQLIDADSTEIEVASYLSMRADIIVDGSRELSELTDEIIDWATRIRNGN